MQIALIPFFNSSHSNTIEEDFDALYLIDVYRATSTMTVASNQGATLIKAIGSLEKAYEEKNKNPGVFLCGERDSQKPEDFDFGNSPKGLTQIDLHEKTCLITTSNGTRALEAFCKNSSKYFACSVLNLNAVAEHIIKNMFERVLVVCAGSWGKFSLEDYLCACLLIKSLNKVIENVEDDIKLALSTGNYYHKEYKKLIRELSNTQHAQKLKSLDKYEDVMFITRNINSFKCVPEIIM